MAANDGTKGLRFTVRQADGRVERLVVDAEAVLVAVHPADVRRILVTSDAGRIRVTCWLFTAAIEKGVLLRSRVLAAQGPAGETAWADELVRGLATAPPPLSA